MKRITKTISAALTSAAMAAALAGLTTTSAYAIDQVPCNSSEYVYVLFHQNADRDDEACFANGGEHWIGDSDYDPWATKIWTGNNRVQWFGDDRWQPDKPIEKWTTFTWPNNPGGVDMEEIRIV